MRYATFRCGPWPKPGTVLRAILAPLRLVLPEANPDFEEAYEQVVTWWFEIDEHNTVRREIAFNADAEPIAAAPLGQNHGIFTDLDSAPEGLGPALEPKAFEEAWQLVSKKWRQAKLVKH
jgi:hypothetical protein